MKILFLCGSLEPGRDGVGDYTRRFAGELIRQGCSAKIISLNESPIINRVAEDWRLQHTQHDQGTAVPVERWPSSIAWGLRENAVVSVLGEGRPEWTSLQFVPYSFHSKGLPIAFSSMTKRIARRVKTKWHLMFHELWVGEDAGASCKHRLLGFWQRKMTATLIKEISPKVVSTSNFFYVKLLQLIGCRAMLLPIYSNFDFSGQIRSVLKQKPARIGVFDSLEREELGRQLLGSVRAREESNGVELRLIGNVDQKWKQLLEESGVEYSESGFVSDDANLFDEFDACTVGLSGTSIFRLGKSGSTAAMLEAGLPVVVGDAGWRPWRFPHFSPPLPFACIDSQAFANGISPKEMRSPAPKLPETVEKLRRIFSDL